MTSSPLPGGDETAGPAAPTWGTWAWVALALTVYAALAISSERGKSAVFDEIIHLPPGYAALKLGDHRMNPLHPPLARIIAAVPLLFMDVKVDPDDLAWHTARPWEWGKRFLYRWNDGDRLLFWGRLPIVALAMVLAVSVFWWARRAWGAPAGFLALVLCVLDPDVLAHGHLVTNDLPVVLFVFLAVIAFERLVRRVTVGRTIAVALAVGAAFATKFSAFALPPILAALALVVAWRPEPLAVAIGPARAVEGRGRKLAILAGLLAVIGLLALGVVWAAYGFHNALTPDPTVDAFMHAHDAPPANPVLRIGARLTRGHLLPEAWVWGFLNCFKSFSRRPSFLLGQYSDRGWWYYFPVAIALKAPLPLLVLVAAAGVLAWTRPAGGRTQWFVWLPPALFLALTMTQNINIGHRHVLAIYPFLFVAASRCAAVAWETRGRAGRAARAAVVGLVVLYAASVLRQHPNYLAYFNEAAGGPSQGWRWLVDSNLDWGQELPGLKKYMDANRIPRLTLCYFGTADPSYYGIEADRLPSYQPPPPSSVTRTVRPGDIVAISATHLQGLYLDPEMLPLMAEFRRRTPVATIGHAIFVYRADFAWTLPGPSDGR
ncbi:MAG TPA: glycosyltransferase family 39 protein [Vicinamibacteria bacterium]|nr:glycosyltransferase family 39 protein [Vicinamibacteria bacterium]